VDNCRANASWIAVKERAFSFDNRPADLKLQEWTDRAFASTFRSPAGLEASTMASISD
jgi:hypothetical protein